MNVFGPCSVCGAAVEQREDEQAPTYWKGARRRVFTEPMKTEPDVIEEIYCSAACSLKAFENAA